MNFYKRYIGDYARDTAHLSLMEHGAYTLLLDTLYSTGRLPDSVDALCRICRAASGAEKRAVAAVAEQFFPVNGDGCRHNKRADKEFTAYSKQADTNRAIAVERERKRKEHESCTDRDTTDSTKGARTPNLSQKPEARKSKRARETPLPEGFAISDRVRAWAEREGVLNLQAHFESFVSKCRSKDYRYVDWDEGFMGAIRKDWAGIGKGSSGGGFPL